MVVPAVATSRSDITLTSGVAQVIARAAESWTVVDSVEVQTEQVVAYGELGHSQSPKGVVSKEDNY